MSRKALKRHAKFLRKKEAYKEKRAMLKEAKRQKREEAGLPDRPQPRQNLDPAAAAEKREAKRRVKAKARDAFRRDSESGPIVVFDMTNEWEKAMTCNERRSLAQQLITQCRRCRAHAACLCCWADARQRLARLLRPASWLFRDGLQVLRRCHVNRSHGWDGVGRPHSLGLTQRWFSAAEGGSTTRFDLRSIVNNVFWTFYLNGTVHDA